MLKNQKPALNLKHETLNLNSLKHRQIMKNITCYSSADELYLMLIKDKVFLLCLCRTYFIEYEFPVAADHGLGGQKNDVGLEITRIATSKTTTQSRFTIIIYSLRKTWHVECIALETVIILTCPIFFSICQHESSQFINDFLGILFNHNSVFPVHFNLPVIKFWCECELKVNIFKRKSGQKSVSITYLCWKDHCINCVHCQLVRVGSIFADDKVNYCFHSQS